MLFSNDTTFVIYNNMTQSIANFTLLHKKSVGFMYISNKNTTYNWLKTI